MHGALFSKGSPSLPWGLPRTPISPDLLRKGSAFLTLEAGYNPSPSAGLELLRVTGGTRHNVVAESAEALLLPPGLWDRDLGPPPRPSVPETRGLPWSKPVK